MKPVLIYLLQVIVISGILYGYYHIALRNKKFHVYNRYYLLSAILLSLLIPFLNIPVYFSNTSEQSSFVIETLTSLSPGSVEESQTVISAALPTESQPFNWMIIPKLLFITIAFALLIRLLASLARIRRIIRNNPVEKLDRIYFVNTTEPGTPYSFFRWLFWNRNIDMQSEKGSQILKHELFHIHQKHSIDVVVIEVLLLLFYLNPFFHLIKKELRAIHEFLADRYAVTEKNKWDYAELLLMQTLDTRQSLINPFFHNQIKRRIAMITTSQKPRYQYLRKIMVLPLACLAIILFAFNYKLSNKNRLTKPLVVVIDAGHGGHDNGAMAPDGTTEKEITLAIAKKIQSINKDENLTILLTRENDVAPLIKERTDFSQRQKADIFISIHVNTSPDKTKSSFEIILPNKNNSISQENKTLASNLMNSLGRIYETAVPTNNQNTSIWVLENNSCPSAMIGCGYISNEKDLKFIKDPSNQEKIAEQILEAISQFANQQPEKNELGKTPLSDTVKPNRPPEVVFQKVEEEPEFPGGSAKWRQYLERNLNIPGIENNKPPNGVYTVVLQFFVDTQGKVSNIKALTNHGYGMEEEAIRVIKKGPFWKPAQQNGRVVNAVKKQPITFQFERKTGAIIKIKNNTTIHSMNGGPAPQLSPGVLYIGINNELALEGRNTDYSSVIAKISHGHIEKTSDNQFIAKVNSISDEVWVSFYDNKNGKEVLITKAVFKSRPVPETMSSTGQTLDRTDHLIKPQKPEISVSGLLKASVYYLLQIPEGTDIISFTFTSDLPSGDIVSIPNSGNRLSDPTLSQIRYAVTGQLITFDNIKIRVDNREKKIPSRIWYVKN